MSLITITQSRGCAGEKIAELVAKRLSLELYDDAKLQHMVQTMGQEFEDFENLFLLMLSFGVKHLPSLDPKISGLQFLLRLGMLTLLIIK